MGIPTTVGLQLVLLIYKAGLAMVGLHITLYK